MMNRETFLSTLSQELDALPKEERDDLLYDYNEHFESAMAEGIPEREIVGKLGSPKIIAKEILLSSSIERTEKGMTAGNILGIIGASIGLSLMNVIFVLGPAIALAGLIFAGWTAGIAFVFSPFIQLAGIAFGFNDFYLFEIFFSAAACGAGILLLIGMYYVSIWCSKGFVKYCKWNLSVVSKGGNKHA